MRKINKCPFCGRSNPENSIFCAYCGKKMSEQVALNSSQTDLETTFKQSIFKIKQQVSKFISNLESKVEDSASISFVNKQRILNLLNQVQFQDQREFDKDNKELFSWVEKVEKAISGEKCIICLQDFVVKEGEKLNVILCPSCNYAGHPNHFIAWLDTRKNCPMCRSNLSKENLLRGYLELKNNQLIFVKI